MKASHSLPREELLQRLAEAEETLNAIRTGQVDAVVVQGPDGERVFSLRTSETAYRLLIESMSEGALWLGTDGTIVYANERFASMVNRAFGAVVGRRFDEFLPSSEQSRFREILGSRPAAVREEFLLVRPDGSTLPALLSIRPFRDEEEEAYVLVATDLTQQKEVERTLASQAAQLEAANRELETFNYSVSHDLRNPLAVLRGSLSLILDDPNPETVREFGPEMKACAERMGQIVQSLLTLSRLSRGDLSRQRVDLSALASEVGSRILAQEHHREVELVVQPGLEDEADPNLILNVFENLMSNACKFTRHQPRARIEFGQTATEHGLAYFVRDNGVGFSMQQAERLFEPFYRLHKQEEFEGSGIGLATVARILRRHGGRIWAQGAPGTGSCFFFTLDAKLPNAFPRVSPGRQALETLPAASPNPPHA